MECQSSILISSNDGFQGCDHRQLSHASCLSNGEEAGKNLEESARYFKMRAVQGYAEAQCNSDTFV